MQKKMLFLFALVLSLSPKSRSEKKKHNKESKIGVDRRKNSWATEHNKVEYIASIMLR